MTQKIIKIKKGQYENLEKKMKRRQKKIGKQKF